MNERKKITWLTPEEAAEHLKCHVSTIYLYMNKMENPLPSHRVFKNKLRMIESELDAWALNNHL